MQVEAAVHRRVEEGFRQDLAIGDDDADIDVKRGEAFGLAFVPEARGREHRQGEAFGDLMHRRLAACHAAPGGARRLGVDGGDVVALADDLGQGRDGEIRRSEKGDAHGGRGIAPPWPTGKLKREAALGTARSGSSPG